MLEEGKGRELLEMLEKARKESDPADLGEDAKYSGSNGFREGSHSFSPVGSRNQTNLNGLQCSRGIPTRGGRADCRRGRVRRRSDRRDD